jgi:hypothetical protein
MYADDTSIYVVGTDIDDLNNRLNNDLIKISEWFQKNLLVVNESKTNCMLICTPQKRSRLPTDKLTVYLNNVSISNVNMQNVLGVIIDNSLKFDIHVDNICKKLSKLQFLFFKIKPYLTYEAKQTFYNSYILPCLDYCITVWGFSRKGNLDKLYRYQKRMGRAILNDYVCSCNTVFDRLGWLTIYERVHFVTLKLVYKCLYDDTPAALKSLFSFRQNNRELPLRNTGVDLNIPIVKSEFRKHCFDFNGISLWNALSIDTRNIRDIVMFKKAVKSHLIDLRPF